MPDGDALVGRLAELRGRYPAADPDMVADVVRAVLASMHGDLTRREVTLLSEVEELGQTIAAAKSEIAALRVDDIMDCHIPSATDELDAIVQHTAAATNSILEVCETLDALGPQLQGDGSRTLQEATTRIYEACSFQDITGQRITKIVVTLKAIESKIGNILTTFGERRAEAAAVPTAPAAPGDESALLNGPQLPGAAMDQTDIDRLLASFD